MRPPKKILLVSEDSIHAGQLKMVLHVRKNYRVTQVSKDKVLALVETGQYDMVLSEVLPHSSDMNQLALAIKNRNTSIPVVLYSRFVNAYERASNADAFIPEQFFTSTMLLDTVSVLIQRKRGPKPNPHAESREFGRKAALRSA